MRRSLDTTEEANVLQKLSIEAACPLPAAVTGGSIGRHARRNYGGPGIKEATGTAAAAQSSGDGPEEAISRRCGAAPEAKTDERAAAAVGRSSD